MTMLYDVRLHLGYEYPRSASGSRHQVRVLPISSGDGQRVVASSITFEPEPSERRLFEDFFGNQVAVIGYRGSHDELHVRMTARVHVERDQGGFDMSPDAAGLTSELQDIRALGPDSPHHFLSATDRVPFDTGVTAYAGESLRRGRTIAGMARELMERIHEDFRYDPDATEVGTRGPEAFALRRGVCQDFSHVMIGGLRGLGIPAGYVSGYLRTIPPPGRPRLEGADAMHAWVRVWCGRDAGWIEFDPTNAILAGNDHIVVARGRDYADVAPIVGVLKTSGKHEATHAVDVVPVKGRQAA